MGFTDIVGQIASRRKVRIGTRSTYMLTQLGKQKVDLMDMSGPSWDVMGYLDENGQCSLKEISDGTHHSEDKVKQILRRLMAVQYVKPVAQEG